jgi:hypothetical protein
MLCAKRHNMHIRALAVLAPSCSPFDTHQVPSAAWCLCYRLGATRLNVYAGLAGFFMLRDSFPGNKPELPCIPFPPPGKGPDSEVRELLLARI